MEMDIITLLTLSRYIPPFLKPLPILTIYQSVNYWYSGLYDLARRCLTNGKKV